MIDVRGPDECWPWRGWRDRAGYGRLSIDGKMRRAHRIAYMRAIRPIPEGLSICHTCDNPPCCNPRHLWVGTTAENQRDAQAKGRTARPRMTVCSRGHALDERNTYVEPSGRPRCRICGNARNRAYKKRRKIGG